MSSVMPLPTSLPSTELLLVLYAPDNRYMARLGSILAGHGQLRWVDSRESTPRVLLDQLGDSAVVLLDYSGFNATYSTELAKQLSAIGASAMVGVADGPEQGAHVLSAVRAGVRDFIDIDSGNTQILEILHRVTAQAAPPKPVLVSAPAPVSQGRFVILLGARAGMGTTTLAAHVASQLALHISPPGTTEKPNSSKVLLLDLGQPTGDGALYLGIDSQFSYEEALRNVDRIDPTFAGSALAHHGSNLAVLGVSSGTLLAPHEPASLLSRLRAVFPLTLCDVGGMPIQHVPTSLLKQATEIWVITDQAIGSLVSLDQAMRDLAQRGCRDERLKLVINRYDSGSGLSDDQIAQRFELPLLATLPDRTRTLRTSSGMGQLVTESAPRDPYARATFLLVQHLDRRSLGQPPASTSRFAHLLDSAPWKKK